MVNPNNSCVCEWCGAMAAGFLTTRADVVALEDTEFTEREKRVGVLFQSIVANTPK